MDIDISFGKDSTHDANSFCWDFWNRLWFHRHYRPPTLCVGNTTLPLFYQKKRRWDFATNTTSREPACLNTRRSAKRHGSADQTREFDHPFRDEWAIFWHVLGVCARLRLRSRCLGGRALIDREAVAMAVNDLPLAVLAAVHMGDAQGIRLERDAVPGHRGVFEADRIG